MRANQKRGLLWFAAPLALCLPCLSPFILGALLTGIGVSTVGSFLSHNASLLAILTVLATLLAMVVGLSVVRLRRGSIRFRARHG